MPKVIPFGDRILVKRKRVGDKAGKEGLIVLTETTADKPTDLATVTDVPDNTFADKELIDNGNDIIKSLTKKAREGSDEALIAMLRFNTYLKMKSIQVGDEVMISKYVGTDYHDSEGQFRTLVKSEDVIGVVIHE